LEKIVRPDCLIGFATSGLPRTRIAAEAAHPERCFVNHPFYPAWRSPPIEVVLSNDEALSQRMLDVLVRLGKVPIRTADVPCFAADDIFCNYLCEAARIVEDGLATPAQVDRIVNDAIGGGGPFNVMDLTGGSPLTVHCQKLMQEAPTGTDWFAPPALLARQGKTPWHDRGRLAESAYHEDQARKVVDRILAVLLGRAYFVVDNNICDAADLNWLTRNALGYREGLLELAERLGAEKVRDLCRSYAATHPGYVVPKSIAEGRLVRYYRDLRIARDGDLAVVTVHRPEVKNALCRRTMQEIGEVFASLKTDPTVKGVVVTSFGGAMAGADIGELAAQKTPEECESACRFYHSALEAIASLGKPVCVAVDGPVMGGGAELSMACHARIVGPTLTLAQPEVNLGIIPGSGGTQRLPRLIGFERAFDLLRTGRPINAAKACEWGWATGKPAADPVAAAKELVRACLADKARIAPLSPEPMAIPATIPKLDIGYHSRAIDAILVDVVRRGVVLPLGEGLALEAAGFARCKRTVDMDIGMKNFIQNGPRVPATFLHE
ncbi:MAG: enoyl-CoA hydratase-related protein, partial [Pseudomonadota bacterium]